MRLELVETAPWLGSKLWKHRLFSTQKQIVPPSQRSLFIYSYSAWRYACVLVKGGFGNQKTTELSPCICFFMFFILLNSSFWPGIDGKPPRTHWRRCLHGLLSHFDTTSHKHDLSVTCRDDMMPWGALVCRSSSKACCPTGFGCRGEMWWSVCHEWKNYLTEKKWIMANRSDDPAWSTLEHLMLRMIQRCSCWIWHQAFMCKASVCKSLCV